MFSHACSTGVRLLNNGTAELFRVCHARLALISGHRNGGYEQAD
jgi:hypothetical protein